jgi:hypothetical protein
MPARLKDSNATKPMEAGCPHPASFRRRGRTGAE